MAFLLWHIMKCNNNTLNRRARNKSTPTVWRRHFKSTMIFYSMHQQHLMKSRTYSGNPSPGRLPNKQRTTGFQNKSWKHQTEVMVCIPHFSLGRKKGWGNNLMVRHDRWCHIRRQRPRTAVNHKCPTTDAATVHQSPERCNNINPRTISFTATSGHCPSQNITTSHQVEYPTRTSSNGGRP
jgi:hypothetical protein